MKKAFLLLMLPVFLLTTGCKPDAQQYFGTAALNSNLLFGFAGSGMERELQSPSVKLVNVKTYETAPMKRAEVLDAKLKSITEHYEQIKRLPSNEDAADMVAASQKLYEYVLPVYRNEYRDLAALYDKGAQPEQIAAMESTIRERYAAGFEALYNDVLVKGNAYASRNGIRVEVVNPVPPAAQR